MKFVETPYGNKVEILKFPDHYVALAVTVDDAGIEADEFSKKIVPAGTIVGKTITVEDDVPTISDGTLIDSTEKVVVANNEGAEGILLNDVDVTYGPASGAMLVHGFVALEKLPEEPDADAIAALAGRILFIQ